MIRSNIQMTCKNSAELNPKVATFDKHTISRTGTIKLAMQQKGLALPLTLILLLVMTLIGIATLRSTTMEENMTANSRLRQVAFNAAETTLREAEIVVGNLAGQRKRALFFGADRTKPIATIANDGDECTNGFCTPAQFTSPVSPEPEGERWEDPNLDVWNNDDRHIQYSQFDDPDLGLTENGVVEAPKYIIEFLGNFSYKEIDSQTATNRSIRPKFSGAYISNCESDSSNALEPPNDTWPYCPTDPAVYRVTVRATAGPPARQAIVTLQSTVSVP